MPAAVAWNLIKKREKKKGFARKRDIHEADFSYLKKVEATYLQIARAFPRDFFVIECVKNGQLLPPDQIHQRVWQLVASILKVKI